MAIHPCYWITLALALSACSQASDHARHTVGDYRTDRALRDTTLKACADDPGALGNTPDCVNAQSATALNGAGGLRNLPQMKLDPLKNPLKSAAAEPGTHPADSRPPP